MMVPIIQRLLVPIAGATFAMGLVFAGPQVGFADQNTKSDRQLKKDIESELTWSPFVDADNVRVEVNNGVATLYGTVDDRDEMQDAIKNAKDAGARRVVNRLRLKEDDDNSSRAQGGAAVAPNGTNNQSDRQLQKRIQKRISQNPYIDPNQVNVTVRDGVATLSGVVESRGAAREAIESAYDSGARRVVSRLRAGVGGENEAGPDRRRPQYPYDAWSDSGTFDYWGY